MDASCKHLLIPGQVDSTLKLHLLLLFHRHPRLCAETRSLIDWLHENPWSIAESLDALARAGFLGRIEGQGGARYRLEACRECWLLLDCLAACYNDPLCRDEIYARVREADQERQFRACLAGEESGLALTAGAW